MENFTLQTITPEISATLVGQRVGRVYQFGLTDLAIDFRLRDGRWLYVSTDPLRLALYLTKRDVRKHAEARTDTGFVALLKKYLSSAKLICLDKAGYDRVVRLDFDAYEISSDGETENESRIISRSLVIELTGRSANIFLLEGERILAALRERTEPTEIYQEPLPAADKADPFDLTLESLNVLMAKSEGNVFTTARHSLIGFDVLYARELATRSENNHAHEALQQLLREIFELPPQPLVYSSAPLTDLKNEPGRADFSVTLAPFALQHLSAQHVTQFVSVNEAADTYFTLLDERRLFLSQRQQMETTLRARLKKQRSLLASLERERAGFANAQLHQRYGELLLASLHNAQKTERGFRVTDYYDEMQPQTEIPAANKPTAQEAAEHYFKLARKARHGLEMLTVRLPETEREITRLESTLSQVEVAVTFETLKTLQPQMPAASPQKQRQQPAPAATRKTKKEELISGVRRYSSSDGYEILVGRASKDNDYLTLKIAKSYDLWFHAADYPGSHVIIRNPSRKAIPPRTLTEAAQLAAKFCQAKTDARIAVNYCERKFVTKPKGFAPGQVRVSSFKTVLVEPKEAGERVL
jgi:predicted ribosome quality control (RQC) complex YloA/Tae2 family protein